MYIQRNQSVNKKTGKIYNSVILCEKYREGDKVKTRTIANLSHLSEHVILSIQNTLKSDTETTVSLKDIEITKCFDYGYVHVLQTIMKQLRIDQVLEKTLSETDAALVKAMIIGKIVTGGSKLCIYNWLGREKEICELLGVDMKGRKIDHFYNSLGHLWLHHSKIEKKWFRYHKGATRRIYLYDLTSTYFEGTQNFFAAYGYNRDGKKGKMQMCVGLLTAENGFPLRIQSFCGNTSDSTTVAEQICSLKNELGANDIVFVGDRGMHIAYNLENTPELANENISFITGLTHEQMQTLISRDIIKLSLFSKDLAEVSVDGKRYILSVNPDLEYKELEYLNNCRQRCLSQVDEIRKSWKKRCTQNEENIGKKQENGGNGKYKNLKTELNVKDIKGYTRRVEEVIKKCGMNKYYSVDVIDNQSFTVNFNQVEFDKSCSLCGKYVVYSNVSAQEMTKEQVRGEYKKLQNVEHAFRDLKSDNINIRPVYHCNENQTRGHVQLCMFAYAIIKSMENILFPFLKEYNQTNKTQLSFNDLIEELKNIKMCELAIGNKVKSVQQPKLNPLQKKILEALNVKMNPMVKVM